MFERNTPDAPPALTAAGDRFFAVAGVLLEAAGVDVESLCEPRRLLVVASLQGIAALVAAGHLSESTADPLLDEATAIFTRPGPQDRHHVIRRRGRPDVHVERSPPSPPAEVG